MDKQSLDLSAAEFENEMQRCIEIIMRHYATMRDANAHPGIEPATVKAWFDETLPRVPSPLGTVLDTVEKTIAQHCVMNIGTKMFAYVMSGGNQVSIIADFLASALNQNVAKWHLAPGMTEIERRVIQWTAEFMHLDSHHGGMIVSSGSAANLAGLSIARNIYAESYDIRRKGLYGLSPLIVYGSTQTHTSIEKSVELLGLGSEHYRKLPVRDDFTIDVDALREQIATDRRDGLSPFCVIGNAGTVNTGAIDPLDQLADIAKAEALWFHVDGAYGGLAASLAEKRNLYHGITRADSIALDYHKWLYQPYEVGCTLVKDWDVLRRSYHKSAEYLEFGLDGDRFDISRHHFDLSRNAKAFKVWMSYKTFGATQLTEMIAKDIALSEYLANIFATAVDFELVDNGPLGIVCARYIGDGDDANTDARNDRLLQALEADGRVFVTGTVLRDRQVLRFCLINHRLQTDDIDELVAVIRAVARSDNGP